MSPVWRLSIAALLLQSACTTSVAPSPTPGAATSASSVAQSVSPEATDAATPSGGLPAFYCLLREGLPTVGGAASIALAHVADVRIGTHPGYDRIVFEFIEDGTPEYRIVGADPPFTRDPSDLPLTVNGSDFFRIILTGGTKLGDDGNPTYTGPTGFEPEFPQLVHLVEQGDFEAVNSWYVGLADSPDLCLRAFVFSDPSRIVIDLEH